ncbi:MAG: CARDB domain-containing protein, partial [Gemmatimonadota bacterium]|nr:CARDB domain-containing protein [Gemmatimonadota bacterium]
FFLQHIMYYDTGSDWFARYEKDLEHEHSRYNLDCPVWDPRVSLRAGERLEMRWDNRGKWWNRKDFSPQWLKFHPHEGIEARTVPPIIYANGRLEFTADPSRYKREAESWSKIRAGRKPSPAFLPAATGRWCHLVYKVRAPYFIPEATISASVFRRTERDSVRVEISTDQGKTWQALWQMGETGETPLKITTDETQRVTWHSSHKYSYLVRFSMLSSGKPGNVRVGQIHLSTDLYYRPVILPELKHGENTVVYSDKSKGRHTRQVTFRWLEDTNILLSDNRPAEGDAIKVTAVVKNQGEAAARDIVVRFYNGDPEKGGEKIGEDQVIGVIEPGGTGRASVRWQASQKQIGAPQGYSLALDAPITGYTHNTLFVRVDPEGKIGESDRSNNVTSRDVIVYNKANLILYHPSFITFDRLGNDQIRITAMIRNQNIYGLLPRAREARDIVVRFYDGPPEIGSPLIGEAVIPEIQRGEFGRAKVVWDTGNLSGRHAIHVQVDPDDRIPEKWQSRPGKYMQIKKEIEL